MNRRSFMISTASLTLATAIPFPAFAATRSGSFTGDSGHTTKGEVTLEDGQITLQDSFWFDGAPDPRVALGKNGKFAPGTDFIPLEKNTGKQTYTIPSNIKASDYDTVVIWCRKFSVPLGYARVK